VQAAARDGEFFLVLQLLTYLIIAAAVTLVVSVVDGERSIRRRSRCKAS
jgi:hypothetical protein